MTRLRILMVTAELAPLAKAGGLGDMVAGLAGALAHAGHDVRILLPRYRGLEPLSGRAPGTTAVAGPQVAPVRVHGTHPPYSLELLAGTGPTIYRLDCPALFGAGGIYGGGEMEARRFALLAHAGLRLCQLSQWSPDIIHCHDWHTALLPGLLKAMSPGDPVLRPASTLLTIHNIGYQGTFGVELAGDLGLGMEAARMPYLVPVSGGTGLNFLRGGIAVADALSTVSPTHAGEILTPEYGNGLDALLRQRRNRLVGILNGVDYRTWDPGSDPALAAHYSAEALQGKVTCQAELRRVTGLRNRPDLPLFGMVSRLAGQKGIELLIGALPAFLDRGQLQAVVLGDGETRYASALSDLARRYGGQLAFISGQDEVLARRVFAGADAFMVPSLYEPCGLTQMYALRYGAVPVVRDTGGLHDTVRHFHPASGKGNGSVFRHADAHGLAWAIGQVLEWHRDPLVFGRVRANGMGADYSWAHQAPLYLQLYQRLAGQPATVQAP